MIALTLDLPLPCARALYGASLPGAEAVPTPFEDVLASMESGAVQEQRAIAFDTCSMFGAAPPTSSPDLTVSAPSAGSPQAPPVSAPSEAAQRDVTPDRARPGGAQRTSPSPHHDQCAERVEPMRRSFPARALAASLIPVCLHPANATRINANISQPSAAAKARVLATLKPENLQPIAISVQETQLGLRVIARGSALDPNDLTELRNEAEALLARHGYRVADLDIATAKKE